MKTRTQRRRAQAKPEPPPDHPNINFLYSIGALLRSWNECNSARQFEAVGAAVIGERYEDALTLLEQLEPMRSAFSKGDGEGKFYAESLIQLKDWLKSRPQQLELL
jgi:hypothetical protein